MQGLELCRRHVAKSGVEAFAIVDDFDEVRDRSRGVVRRRVFFHEDFFLLKRFHEAFAGGVIGWGAGTAHAWNDSKIKQNRDILERRVLNALIAVMNQPCLGPTLANCHVLSLDR